MFVLCLKHLFHLISLAEDHLFWKPIQLARGGPKISHLAFADDLLLFVEASLDQVEVIKTILDLFCNSSGQKISQDKSSIFFSNIVQWQAKVQITEQLGFRRIENLRKYLGVPILHKRVKKQPFQFVIDKVSRRLSTWKPTNLSLARRVTLTKSVLQALLSYVMQTALLPCSVCDEVDKLCSSFVWGGLREPA